MAKTSKWRWGKNRWIILAFILLNVVGVILAKPVQSIIQVAPENLKAEPLFTLPYIGSVYLTNTLVAMVLMDLVILLVAWIVKSHVKKDTLVATGLTGVMEMLIEVLYNLTQSTAGKWAKKIFPWFASIFIVVLFANLIKLVPIFETFGIVEEVPANGYSIVPIAGHWYNVTLPAVGEGGYNVIPFLRGISTDLNFTLSLALISVLMTQVIGVQALGLGYFSKFLNFTTMFKKPFFGFMDFIVGILETISEFAKIISFTFRLFGNMFAGMVLLILIGVMVPVFAPSLIMMFELFIGAIQAFVFGMLTLVFMAMATSGHGDEEHAAG